MTVVLNRWDKYIPWSVFNRQLDSHTCLWRLQGEAREEPIELFLHIRHYVSVQCKEIRQACRVDKIPLKRLFKICLGDNILCQVAAIVFSDDCKERE